MTLLPKKSNGCVCFYLLLIELFLFIYVTALEIQFFTRLVLAVID